MPKRSCDNGGSGGKCLVHDGLEGRVEAAPASTLRVRPRNLPRSLAENIVSRDLYSTGLTGLTGGMKTTSTWRQRLWRKCCMLKMHGEHSPAPNQDRGRPSPLPGCHVCQPKDKLRPAPGHGVLPQNLHLQSSIGVQVHLSGCLEH